MTAFVGGAVKSGAAFVVRVVDVDAKVEAHPDRLQTLFRRPFERDALHPADAGCHLKSGHAVRRRDWGRSRQ